MLPLGADSDPNDCQLIELQALQDYRVFAATTLQRFVRGHQCRQRLAREKRHQERVALSAEASASWAALRHKAATTIQNAWRSFTGQRTFKFYRNLLSFKQAGDPRELLRTINPREAQLLEPATGAHVRFRLDGCTWPPLVVYKIFVHRPVADICAFGPRDYAAEQAQARKQQAAACDAGASSSGSTANTTTAAEEAQSTCSSSSAKVSMPDEYRMYLKANGTIGYRSTAGWYRRQDNLVNNWRPVVDRLLLTPQQQQQWGVAVAAAAGNHAGFRRAAAAADGGPRPAWGCSGTGNGCSSKAHYQPPTHYSSLVRKQQRVRLMKQKRREWLMRLFRAGMEGGTLDAEQLQQLEQALEQQQQQHKGEEEEGPAEYPNLDSALQDGDELADDHMADDWAAVGPVGTDDLDAVLKQQLVDTGLLEDLLRQEGQPQSMSEAGSINITSTRDSRRVTWSPMSHRPTTAAASVTFADTAPVSAAGSVTPDVTIESTRCSTALSCSTTLSTHSPVMSLPETPRQEPPQQQPYQQQQQQQDPDIEVLEGQLVAWAQHLDFDAYAHHWRSTAISLASEALPSTVALRSCTAVN